MSQIEICQKKRKYRTRRRAVDAMMALLKKGSLATSMGFYECPVCEEYHLTKRRAK